MTKIIIPISAALILALSSPVSAQDAASVLAEAEQALGLEGATALTLTARGSLQDTGEAAGGNAPVPVVSEYVLDLDLTTPANRLRIHRTNPDGSELRYGATELQFVSGNYVWQVFSGQSFPPPGAGGPPGEPGGAPPGGDPATGGPPPDGDANAGGPPPGFGAPSGPPPKPEDTFDKAGGPTVLTGTLAQARQAQIALTPAGFLTLARKNNATIGSDGDNQVVSFSANGQEFAGTISGEGLLTEVATIDPLSGLSLTATFSNYQQFGTVTYPSTVVHLEGDVTVANLTVVTVEVGPIPEITVPESVSGYDGP